MHNRNYLYLLSFYFIFLLTPYFGIGQAKRGIPNDKSLHNAIVTEWNTKNKLVTNKVIDVKQSLEGYIWLATYDGVLRFDGREFDLYNSFSTSEMEQDTYYVIEETRDSVLWILSRGDGIFNYRNGSFSRFDEENKLPSSFRFVFVDSRQRLWLAGFEDVFCVESDSVLQLEHPAIREYGVLKIAEDNQGRIYLGTDGGGVVVYDKGSYLQLTKKDGLVDDIIISLEQGLNGDVIAGTFEGISIINSGAIRNIDYTGRARVNAIHVDDYGNILLGTDQGLFRVNENEGIYESIGEEDILPSREINDIEIDHESNIWLATERGGLVQLKFGNIGNYTSRKGLSLDRTNIVVQRNKHEYWVGSDNGDIDIIDVDSNSVRQFKTSTDLSNIGIRDFLFDEGTVWIASYNGLLKVEKGKEHNYTEENGLSSRLIRTVIKDAIGNLWIGTRSGGINKMEPDGTIKVYDRTNGLHSNYILSLLEMDGEIYAGTNRGGISIIGRDGKVRTYADSVGNTEDPLYFNIRPDTQGRIWLATNIGLVLFVQGNFIHITLHDDISSKSIFDIRDDGRGYFWLTSSRGLLRLPKQEIEEYLANKTDKVNYKLFTDSDGLPSSECTAATRILADADGIFWIPTNGGIGILDPNRIEPNRAIPPVYVKSFVIDDSLYSPQENITVTPGKLRYSIGFTALSYRAPENMEFRYQLSGLDKNWHATKGDQREIEYTNIPPGRYVFKVMASNNDGVWNEQETEMKFVVEPFFYETSWFYLLLIAFFLATTIFIAQWRISRLDKRNIELQKLNAELDSFVYSTSHDLRAPLSSVLGLINIAKIDADPQQKDIYLDMMESSIKRLDRFIHDIIDYSRNARLSLTNSAFDIKRLVEDLLHELKFMDNNETISKEVNVSGDSVVHGDVQRIKIILNNLISNSLKYFDRSKAEKKIVIDIGVSKGFLKIRVSDNGIGISDSHMEHIFEMFYRATEMSEGSGIGLYIVKETVDKLAGKIAVSSKLGEETTFEVSIPIPENQL